MVLIKIHLPLTEKLKLTPLLKITLTMTLMTRRSMIMTLMSLRTPTGNYQKVKESSSPMEPSPQRRNQKVNKNLLTQIQEYLVFSNCVDQLLKCCPKCYIVVTGQKKKTTGSMLSVEMICLDGHITHWDSQPIIQSGTKIKFLPLDFLTAQP